MNDSSSKSENLNKDVATSDSLEKAQESSSKRIDRSRVAILCGWLVSMIGVVTYCFAMLGMDEKTDHYSSLFERGAMGWAAIFFLLVGVTLWLTGSVMFLREAKYTAAENNSAEDAID